MSNMHGGYFFCTEDADEYSNNHNKRHNGLLGSVFCVNTLCSLCYPVSVSHLASKRLISEKWCWFFSIIMYRVLSNIKSVLFPLLKISFTLVRPNELQYLGQWLILFMLWGNGWITTSPCAMCHGDVVSSFSGQSVEIIEGFYFCASDIIKY